MGYVAMALCGLSLLLGFVRLVRGPSIADRIVALDLLSGVAVGMIAAWAVVSDQTAYLDVALLVALVAFLGGVALARHLESGVER
jgi:multicomponent Na+:H+ antiporter subunit F